MSDDDDDLIRVLTPRIPGHHVPGDRVVADAGAHHLIRHGPCPRCGMRRLVWSPARSAGCGFCVSRLANENGPLISRPLPPEPPSPPDTKPDD